MPEGDTIHYAANRIRPILAGRVPELRTPHPRLRGDRWPDRLGGREVTAVDAHGKHLFLHFEGDLVIHSHLRMTGSWGTYRAGQRWRRSPRRAWLVMSAADRDVVQFDGPVLELMTESRSRFDQRIAGLGPDICVDGFDEDRFLRRLREEDPTRPIGDVLLQQQVVAGIGNLWKAEGCWAAKVDPWRPAGKVGDDEALAIIHGPAARACSAPRWTATRPVTARSTAATACPAPAAARSSRSAGSGRTTARRTGAPGASGEARRPQGRRPPGPGNTPAAFAAAMAAGVDMLEFDVLPAEVDGTGELYLSHDYTDLRSRQALTLDEGLEHLAGDAYAGVELDVDLKLPGYEERVIEALRRHGLLGRSLVSSTERSSLRVVRGIAPDVRLGLSVPKLRKDPTTRRRTKYAALALAVGARLLLPTLVARRIRSGEMDAVMVHFRLMSPRLLRAVRAAGGEVYVWTVDDAATVRSLVALGVDGIITNDPRLFTP